ncbi:MAG TPA: hypothetical protein VNA18_05045, partial [Nitrososphaeraceae archaeon]|nr:hypothetical protein [Nitrososphaeraceae archaeon]
EIIFLYISIDQNLLEHAHYQIRVYLFPFKSLDLAFTYLRFKERSLHMSLILFSRYCAYIIVLASTLAEHVLNSLIIPQGLIDLLVQNSLNRERLSTMTTDDLALLLSIDTEAAKLILNALTNSSNYMIHDMRELR